MLRATRIVLALALGMSAAPGPYSARWAPFSAGGASPDGNPAQQATVKPVAVTTPDIPFSEYDSGAEQQLLDLANQARAQAGAPALALDPGLSQAARAHAEAMFAARQLSHQFDGEPSLPQ